MNTPKDIAIKHATQESLYGFEKLERLAELFHNKIINEDEFTTLCKNEGL